MIFSTEKCTQVQQPLALRVYGIGKSARNSGVLLYFPLIWWKKDWKWIGILYETVMDVGITVSCVSCNIINKVQAWMNGNHSLNESHVARMIKLLKIK